MDRVAQHCFLTQRGERRVRVDLHGVGVFDPDGTRTLIPWENITRIGVEPRGVCVESFGARITVPRGAFGLAEEALASELERGRSIQDRPLMISDLLRGASRGPRTRRRPWRPRATTHTGPATQATGRRPHGTVRSAPPGSSGPDGTLSAGTGGTANLLAAVSLLVADRMRAAMTEVVGQSLTTTSALVALDQLLPESSSVGALSETLGLSPSGTVRLVDRLEEAGYVVRRARTDRRDRRRTTLGLTPTGREVAQRAMFARAAVLEDVLAGVPPGERRGLRALLWRLLAESSGAVGDSENHLPVM